MHRREKKQEVPKILLITHIEEMNNACNTLIDSMDSLLRNGVLKRSDYSYYLGCISDIDILITDIEDTLSTKPQTEQKNNFNITHEIANTCGVTK